MGPAAGDGAYTDFGDYKLDSMGRIVGRKPQLKGLLLVALLFLAGAGCLLGGGIVYGRDRSLPDPKSANTALAFLVLGGVLFVPGLYYARIAYNAWRGVEGFSFASIPEL